MNLHDDATIHRLLIIIVAPFIMFLLAGAAITGGLKMFLYAIWVFTVLGGLFAVVFFLPTGFLPKTKSKNAFSIIFKGYVSYFLYGINAFFLAVATMYVLHVSWQFFFFFFPDNQKSVVIRATDSTMPVHPEVR